MSSLRYLAVIWGDRGPDPAILGQFAGRTGLALRCTGEAFSVLTNEPGDLIVFPDKSGVVIGKLFHRHGPPAQLADLPQEAVDAVQSSHGGKLLERYWGGYVGIFRSSEGVAVVRDPSGALPSYYLSWRGSTIFASDADLLLQAGLLLPDVNWPVLGRSLYRPDIPEPETALAGVFDLLAGTMLSLKSGGQGLRQIWSPWDHISGDGGDDVAGNAVKLKRTVQSCVSAWGSCYRRPLIGVSGGLDSSIVAACLAASSGDITCLTMATEDPVGDERPFARAIAAHIGAPLIEDRYDLADCDISRSATAHLPRPSGRTQALAYNAAILRTSTASGNDALFSGNGGDNVFYLTHSARPLVDRVLAAGISPLLIATVRDIAAITNASIWQIVGEAWRVWKARRAQYQWHCEPEFLSRDFVLQVARERITHPWLNAVEHAAPGKRAQVAMLVRMQLHLQGRDRAIQVPTINPLTSQPVMEICLGIPTWHFCAEGRDRGVARLAFAEKLPSSVLNRKSKGGPQGFVAQIVDGNVPAIRTRLLDGRLAEKGYLDRAALEAALASGPQRKLDYSRIVSLLDAEAWLDRWSSIPTGDLR